MVILMEKTNAIRMVEQNKIRHKIYTYPHEEGICVDGQTVAELLNQDVKQVFKTIVLISNNKYYVCLVPVCEEIDLKKAAKAFGLKSVEMLPMKELLSVTGYIRGGCSPIGMKKNFPTVVDDSALSFGSIILSGGKIGLQIEMSCNDLKKLINCKFENIKKVKLC